MSKFWGNLPSTDWSRLQAVQKESSPECKEALDHLIRRYWLPVYHYICRRGHSDEDAKDLTQSFFASWLVRGSFGKADPARGRFRAFLFSSLDNFLANAHRAEFAQHRCPPGGLVSVHQLASDSDIRLRVLENESPEVVFHRAWLLSLLIRVLGLLEKECSVTGKRVHFEIFRRRIIEPALNGTDPVPMTQLAEEHGLTMKQAANRLLTARRAYQRLLRQETWVYASSKDDVAEEIRDLFDYLTAP